MWRVYFKLSLLISHIDLWCHDVFTQVVDELVTETKHSLFNIEDSGNWSLVYKYPVEKKLN